MEGFFPFLDSSYYGLLMIHGNNKSFDVVFCSLAAAEKKKDKEGAEVKVWYSVFTPLWPLLLSSLSSSWPLYLGQERSN